MGGEENSNQECLGQCQHICMSKKHEMAHKGEMRMITREWQ
jgi:hypothetical protein